MKRQEREKIKAAAKEVDAFKVKRKRAAIRLFKYILFGGLGCLAWTLTMLITIIIASDINEGVKIFSQVNSYLYMLYAILVGISVFIYLLEYIIKKKQHRGDEIIVEDPTNYKYKN